MTTTPAQQVYEAFRRLPRDTWAPLADALTGDDDPFISDIGHAVMAGPTVGPLLIDAAMGPFRFDHDGAMALADTLGSDPPWAVLAVAIRRTVTEPRPDDLPIYPDVTADGV